MPEYLSPGVYIEEVDTGNQPIEGVSTSIVGMVGVTERGPTNIGILVTSAGEFKYWFGQYLNADTFQDHCFLPHAVDGFFTNGGKQAYIVRISPGGDPGGAIRTSGGLFDRGSGTPSSMLLRSAAQYSGTSASVPPLLVLDQTGLTINAGDWYRIGDGSSADYGQTDTTPADTSMVPVGLPLSRSHDSSESAVENSFTSAALTGTLTAALELGTLGLGLKGLSSADIAALTTVGVALQIDTGAWAEYRFFTVVAPVPTLSTSTAVDLLLDSPLQLPHAATAPIAVLTLTATVTPAQPIDQAMAGDGVFYIQEPATGTFAHGNLIQLGSGATQEIRPMGALTHLVVTPPTVQDYAAGWIVQQLQLIIAQTAGAQTTTVLTLGPGETANFVVGQKIVVDPFGTPETATIQLFPSTPNQMQVTTLTTAPAVGIDVIPAPKQTTALASAGGKVLALNDRMGIAVGTILSIGGTGTAAPVVTVVGVPAITPVAPNAGSVVVFPPLAADVANGTNVYIQSVQTTAIQPTALALLAPSGTQDLYVTDGTGYVANDLIAVTTASGATFYHNVTTNSAQTVTAVNLTQPLGSAHAAGSTFVQRGQLFDVQALDTGSWGDRIRLSVQDESPGLVKTTLKLVVTNHASPPGPPPDYTKIQLASSVGVEPGTVLEFADPITGLAIGTPVKVTAIDRVAQFTITVTPSLSLAQQVVGVIVRSREFSLTVSLLRQPDPATPSRDNQILDSEVFRFLSMDPGHSNYIEKIVGSIDGPLRKSDRRPEGGSLYIRVLDDGDAAAQASVRLGPEVLWDKQKDGRLTAALLPLEGTPGDDGIGSIDEQNDYVGLDNVDPELRTGLVSLQNIEQVSVVAIPGRTSDTVQQGVIDHCELMRYRFAVLDSVPEPDDTLTDVQDQRSNYDTKYAALYYPWLAIPDPFPTNLANIKEYAIPPSGHVLGVYARTDIDRGVHKAPANELVNGIINLRRKINKDQQDILNPYPSNINVIRDFREQDRGIRVYGARVITSDSDWKYVNVRRLIIFIEQSLDIGLQWVVFEPNSEQLWARVERTIKNFLTTVWRNGALEGASVDEAFYVKCDATTMTQDDIDNGRLIVLVGVAPVMPAEFVIVRIGLWTANASN